MPSLEHCPFLKIAEPGQFPDAVCAKLGLTVNMFSIGDKRVPQTLKKCIMRDGYVNGNCQMEKCLPTDIKRRVESFLK